VLEDAIFKLLLQLEHDAYDTLKTSSDVASLYRAQGKVLMVETMRQSLEHLINELDRREL
jgi:hypothetical protein